MFLHKIKIGWRRFPRSLRICQRFWVIYTIFIILGQLEWEIGLCDIRLPQNLNHCFQNWENHKSFFMKYPFNEYQLFADLEFPILSHWTFMALLQSEYNNFITITHLKLNLRYSSQIFWKKILWWDCNLQSPGLSLEQRLSEHQGRRNWWCWWCCSTNNFWQFQLISIKASLLAPPTF